MRLQGSIFAGVLNRTPRRTCSRPAGVCSAHAAYLSARSSLAACFASSSSHPATWVAKASSPKRPPNAFCNAASRAAPSSLAASSGLILFAARRCTNWRHHELAPLYAVKRQFVVARRQGAKLRLDAEQLGEKIVQVRRDL